MADSAVATGPQITDEAPYPGFPAVQAVVQEQVVLTTRVRNNGEQNGHEIIGTSFTQTAVNLGNGQTLTAGAIVSGQGLPKNNNNGDYYTDGGATVQEASLRYDLTVPGLTVFTEGGRINPITPFGSVPLWGVDIRADHGAFTADAVTGFIVENRDWMYGVGLHGKKNGKNGWAHGGICYANIPGEEGKSESKIALDGAAGTKKGNGSVSNKTTMNPNGAVSRLEETKTGVQVSGSKVSASANHTFTPAQSTDPFSGEPVVDSHAISGGVSVTPVKLATIGYSGAITSAQSFSNRVELILSPSQFVGGNFYFEDGQSNLFGKALDSTTIGGSAAVAYNDWKALVGGLNWSGDPIPLFEDAPDELISLYTAGQYTIHKNWGDIVVSVNTDIGLDGRASLEAGYLRIEIHSPRGRRSPDNHVAEAFKLLKKAAKEDPLLNSVFYPPRSEPAPSHNYPAAACPLCHTKRLANGQMSNMSGGQTQRPDSALNFDHRSPMHAVASCVLCHGTDAALPSMEACTDSCHNDTFNKTLVNKYRLASDCLICHPADSNHPDKVATDLETGVLIPPDHGEHGTAQRKYWGTANGHGVASKSEGKICHDCHGTESAPACTTCHGTAETGSTPPSSHSPTTAGNPVWSGDNGDTHVWRQTEHWKVYDRGDHSCSICHPSSEPANPGSTCFTCHDHRGQTQNATHPDGTRCNYNDPKLRNDHAAWALDGNSSQVCTSCHSPTTAMPTGAIDCGACHDAEFLGPCE